MSVLSTGISLWLATGAKDDIIELYDRLLELSGGLIDELFRRIKDK